MLVYVVKRLLWAVVVVLGISLLAFVLLSRAPGDPARVYAGPQASTALIGAIRHEWGLDRPLPIRYLSYLGHLLHGDLGHSFLQDQDVLPAILARLPATVQLALCGLLTELLVAFALGSLAAARPGGWLDRALLALTVISISTPTFLLALLLLIALGGGLHWLPLGGYGPFWPRYVILPALAIGIPGGAWYSRLLRTALLETRRLDLVRTARAKGASRARVLLCHVLPIAVLPLLPIIGADLSTLLGGVAVVESVTNWPGIGLQAFNGLKGPDVPLVLGTVLLASSFVVLVNLAADLAVAAIDPRVRLAG